MKVANVKLILQRELRDQLRDRRTLFMIAILPLLLYPLMGMAFLQMAQFLQEHPNKVLLIGASALPETPRLLDGDAFDPSLFAIPDRAYLLQVVTEAQPLTDAAAISKRVSAELDANRFDAVVVVPPDFSDRLATYLDVEASERSSLPSPELFFNGAKDQSRIAYDRVFDVLSAWRGKVVELNLESREIPPSTAHPFDIANQDVAAESGRRAAFWSKVLPFVVIVWALTGAFYPAVDLCAGEKERGTLETLLSSPAERREIVWGKLLTVAIFSVATSLLNMISLTTTGAVIMSRLQPVAGAASGPMMGAPPISTLGWLLLALIPLAALFSALSLALATMARSTKEGQYYLMPLLLVTLPLAMIPILPSTEINLGNSLVPVTGVMLLLRSFIEGEYLTALPYVAPVVIVTGICCTLAIRWAEHQFNDESVLFREGERFAVRAWLVHLVRDRAETPSLAEGFMAGVILLLLQFFVRLVGPAPTSWSGFVLSTVIVQFALILAPVLLMAVMLTSDPKRTFLIKMPSVATVFAAVLLAILIHPAAVALRDLVQQIYPIRLDALEQLKVLAAMFADAPTWQLLLLLGVLPAVCEELAFRGFILSGLRHLGQKGMAILISAAFFGVTHGILQQSVNAFILGCLLGYLAVQTGSVLPCILFHAVHNSLQLLAASFLTAERMAAHPQLQRLLVEASSGEGGLVYRAPIVVASVIASCLLLLWFRSLPFSLSPEERIQEAIDHQPISA